ncbi:phage protein D [Candidatus Methanoperedens nitroreducens]|uniref:Phage protein D n=1 Tax=Candidatus Methanoperedens nitratireducens TaxID=1392998 RepID=A0A062V571_9EURY|nr:contractile injection system protein, VgrG/Pvc8 family [Candidatus Methanoperedens nitroreducens]KCZ70550.1 phage protein D [Candidatus Methanoperedens nitroreducens]MDJ1420402.1 contractile injection system protein, VgrG/Pvc8 family [Candidatus Methanoperedens sp.]
MAGNILNVASFRLLLDGSELPTDLFLAVNGVTVEDELNLPAMFTIRFNTVDFLKGDWRGIDLKTFKVGDIVKISMGIDSSFEMMIGEVTSLDFTFGDSCFMEIRGYDRLHRLRFGTMRRSFKDMKDSDIASSIASETSLTPKVDDTGTIHPYIFQNNQSNYEFLLERAKRIGYEMLVDDKTLIFRKSQEDKSPELTLEYGVDLESFSAQIKTLTEGSKVEVRGWNVKDKEEISSSASKGSETTKMGKESGYEISEKAFSASSVSVVDDMIIDSKDAENIAKAKYNQMLGEFLTGEGSCIGNPEIRAGKTIEIKGIGERLSGVYYVESTVHSISRGVYTTNFKVRRTGV